jgi:hypothetical protein
MESQSERHRYYSFVRMSEDEVRDGLAAYQQLAADRFEDSSVTYDGGHVRTTIYFDDRESSEEIAEWVIESLKTAFPSLGEDLSFDDELLGTLHWLEDVDGYEGVVALEGGDVDLILHCPAEQPPPAVVQRARDIVANWPQWRQSMNPSIVAEKLQLYNDGWRDHDEAATGGPLDPESFLKRLTLTTININLDLSFEVTFWPDGMFTEHYIDVQVAPDKTMMVLMQ